MMNTSNIPVLTEPGRYLRSRDHAALVSAARAGSVPAETWVKSRQT